MKITEQGRFMRTRKRHVIWSIALVVAGIAGAEVFARYYLGLGTPPLTISHPKIEYMLKPNQDVYRFGNHFIVNQYGMRAVPFTPQKRNGEYRVMVFGDSVLNGGNQTDHASLATSLLADRLSEVNQQKVVVGNISAGSWGPGNWRAYVEAFGFFDADIVVLVVSSHDYADNPTFQALNEDTHPTEKPLSALLEGVTKYLPRYLPLGAGKKRPAESDRFGANKNELKALKALDDMRRFLELAQSNSTTVLVLQHWEKSELESGCANPGCQRIKVVCEQIGISPISLEPFFRRSIENGANPYRDNIHINEIGQQIIAETIFANMPHRVAGGEDFSASPEPPGAWGRTGRFTKPESGS